jgi:lipoate-protein ligase B
LNLVDLGYKDYKEVWDLQKTIHRKRVDGEVADTLLIVEHNPVITMGKSGKGENLLLPFELLEKKGVSYYHIERGGDVTYHGPGQLVGYPIINIRNGLVGIKPYIQKLEQVIIKTLAQFGIEGETKEKMIGVWTKKGKICSIGVAVKRWVTFHGFALNVNTDLKYFDFIVPCGLPNIKMISMQKILKREVPLEEVKNDIIKNFGSVFNNKIERRCLAEII